MTEQKMSEQKNLIAHQARQPTAEEQNKIFHFYKILEDFNLTVPWPNVKVVSNLENLSYSETLVQSKTLYITDFALRDYHYLNYLMEAFVQTNSGHYIANLILDLMQESRPELFVRPRIKIKK